MGETLKKHAKHGFTSFELTKDLLNKLQQFKVTPTAKLVLLYLATCYNPNKADMFPKQKTIANKIGVSERSVVRAIQELFKAGLIIIECKYTNRYKFTSKIVSECPENLSDHKGQKDILKRDNLSRHDKEQIKTKKEQTNNVVALKISDREILEDYAKKNGAENIQAYVNALYIKGVTAEIIKQYREKEVVSKYWNRQAEKTSEIVKEITNYESDAPTENFKALKAKLIELCAKK